jgi:hypothetical protein
MAGKMELRVPGDVTLRAKPKIAHRSDRDRAGSSVAPGVLLAYAGYNAGGAFGSGVTASGLGHVVGVQ